MTKIFGLAGLGALGGIAAAAAIRSRRAAAKRQQEIDAFDFTDLDEPVVIAEEVVIVTEADPYGIDMEFVPVDDTQQQAKQQEADSSFEMPGRGAGPR